VRAAVNRKYGTGREPRARTREIERRRNHFIGLSTALHRNVGPGPFIERIHIPSICDIRQKKVRP